jgi:hypothetical protein
MMNFCYYFDFATTCNTQDNVCDTDSDALRVILK